jgi:glycosyltransferase involved in cell wall biosynthesis
VPAAVEISDFASLPPREAFRASHLGAYDGPLILFLGRITYKKGIDLLIDAFAQLRAERECRLVIAGPDDERLTPALRARARERGVEDQVTFAGPVYGEDRLAALAAADVWALPSHTENFGIAVIEAMAAGCPVVISPAVNLAPAARGAGAALVPALDPPEIAGALRRALTDECAADLRRAGHRLAASFDVERVAPQLERMYAQVAGHC